MRPSRNAPAVPSHSLKCRSRSSSTECQSISRSGPSKKPSRDTDIVKMIFRMYAASALAWSRERGFVMVVEGADSGPTRHGRGGHEVLSRLGATLLGNRDMRLFLAAQGLDSVAIGVASVGLPWLPPGAGHTVGFGGLVYPLTSVQFVISG